jgi:uncharacterized membrane protein
MEFLKFVLILSALCGFLLSFYIYKKKHRKETMTCPIGSDCDSVVNSDYSKFFGVNLEIWGIIYYGVILASYTLLYAIPLFYSPFPVLALVTFSTVALLFSAYLTVIQWLVLKEWCTWCLTSAFLSTLIFLSSIAASQFTFIEILAYNQGLLFFIHLIGIALGIGAASIADVFFLRFLKDFKISLEESAILRIFGQILWFALAIVIITSMALYLPSRELAIQSPQFLIEMFVLVVITINAVYLTLIISPRLVAMSFDKESTETKEQDRQKKVAFASGAISLVSWYVLLVLVSPLPIYYSFTSLLLGYIGLLFIAIAISQFVHNFFESSAIKRGY